MDKLKVLTEKLFNEGIDKGNKEANEIVANAKKEAEKIINAAKEEASKILEGANKDADDKKKKTDGELKLAATQSVSLLKNQISNLLSTKLIEDKVEKALDDKAFIQKMILTLLESWASNGADAFDARLYLPKVNGEELKGFIQNNCKNQIDKGLELDVTDEIKSGFKIGPKDSSYVVEFSEDSFNSFFKEFLKPATRDLIFQNKS